MGILMKSFFLFVFFLTVSYSQPHTFLVKKYDKEIELESKIIGQIAHSSVQKDVVLYIPKMTEMERKIYSKIFTLGKNCEESNFIFVKKNIDKSLCNSKEKLFFTNNYKKLLSNKKYYGAFFWSKSRPNIVFIKDRLAKHHIALPKAYTQFIEDL